MTFIRGSLSRRGTELADVEDYRDKFKAILSNLYDPVKNPTGYVNFGTSQNVSVFRPIKKNFTTDGICISVQESNAQPFVPLGKSWRITVVLGLTACVRI